MLEFLTENLGTVIVGAVVLSLLCGVITLMIIGKKREKGSTSCGCGCAGCPMADKCRGEKK